MVTAFDTDDFVILTLALDLLSRHTDEELSTARKRNNNSKQMAMLAMPANRQRARQVADNGGRAVSDIEASVRPECTTDNEAHKQLQTLKDGGIATAVRLLRRMEDDLGEIESFIYVGIAALRAQDGDATYVKLLEHVNDDVRNALKALGQDGAQ